MPFAGAILAVLFHEFIYKKTIDAIQESEDADALLDK